MKIPLSILNVGGSIHAEKHHMMASHLKLGAETCHGSVGLLHHLVRAHQFHLKLGDALVRVCGRRGGLRGPLAWQAGGGTSSGPLLLELVELLAFNRHLCFQLDALAVDVIHRHDITRHRVSHLGRRVLDGRLLDGFRGRLLCHASPQRTQGLDPAVDRRVRLFFFLLLIVLGRCSGSRCFNIRDALLKVAENGLCVVDTILCVVQILLEGLGCVFVGAAGDVGEDVD